MHPKAGDTPENPKQQEAYTLVKRQAPLVKQAILGGWVSDDVGLMLVEEMARVVEYSDSPRDKVAAGRVLAALASVDARRESTSTSSKNAEAALALDALRTAMRSSESSQLFSQLASMLPCSEKTALTTAREQDLPAPIQGEGDTPQEEEAIPSAFVDERSER